MRKDTNPTKQIKSCYSKRACARHQICHLQAARHHRDFWKNASNCLTNQLSDLSRPLPRKGLCKLRCLRGPQQFYSS